MIYYTVNMLYSVFFFQQNVFRPHIKIDKGGRLYLVEKMPAGFKRSINRIIRELNTITDSVFNHTINKCMEGFPPGGIMIGLILFDISEIITLYRMELCGIFTQLPLKISFIFRGNVCFQMFPGVACQFLHKKVIAVNQRMRRVRIKNFGSRHTDTGKQTVNIKLGFLNFLLIMQNMLSILNPKLQNNFHQFQNRI